jgi:hypothetical protein
MSTRLVEGKVGRTEWVQKGDKNWFLAHIYNESKPVAFGYDPGIKAGDKLSIEAQEGVAWMFQAHRSPAITPKENPVFIVVEHFPTWKGRSADIAQMIMSKLTIEGYVQVTGNDVLDHVRKEFPEKDARIIGAAFQGLSRRRVIHKVGDRQSALPDQHSQTITVWELTKK